MDDQKFLQHIFNGYASCFHKGFWHTSSNYSDMTTADLNFFSTLGQSLGFRVRREMNWQYPRDLCWCQTNETKSDFDANTLLYLERENKDGRVGDTIEKMLNPINAPLVPYLVALFGWVKPSTLSKAKKQISSSLLPNQSFLLISWVGDNQNGDNWILEGWCLSGQKATTRKVDTRIDENGHWYAVAQLSNVWLASGADEACENSE